MPPSTSSSISVRDRLAQRAAEWIVSLTADDESERVRAQAGFEAWKRADPRHAAAAADMERLIGRVEAVRGVAGGDPRPAHAALDKAFATERKRGGARRSGARRAVTALLLALALVLPAWFAIQTHTPAYLLADFLTSTGEWKTHTLSDGTRITLGSASAVNLRYDERRRTVELVQGDILVDVAKDAARPFVVETRQGSIRALGTRFVVDREPNATVLTMLESEVAVRAVAGRDEDVRVHGGQRVRIDRDGVGPIEAIDARSVGDAWKYHQLVISDRPLAEVLDELGRHRPGRIHYDREQIAGIRVTAVLPLDDTGRALRLLLTNFPDLRIRMVTPYLVLVDAPARAARQ